MIDPNTATKVMTEINEIGSEIFGESAPMYVCSSFSYLEIRLRHRIWDNEDGSDWTFEKDFDVQTEEQLRTAVIGELEGFATFLKAVVDEARKREVAERDEAEGGE